MDLISKQSLLISALVVVAFGALILGCLSQGNVTPEGQPIVGANPTTDDTVETTAAAAGGRIVNQDGELGSTEGDPTNVNPIESFLPESPTGANCTEAVGVDLIAGYAASLVINGQPIPPEEMNGADPETGAIPAGRTQGKYTFGPEQGCPNGAYLRPRNNTLQACVYKIESGPETCIVSQFTFNAL